MKILIFSWRGPKHPHAGGAEIVTHEYARAWVKAGHDVTLFTSWFKGAKDQEFIDGVNIVRQGSQITGVQFAAVSWYLFKTSEKFDLVIDQFHGIPFFTPLFVRTPKLAFIHEVAKDVWLLNHMKFPLNILYGLVGKLTEPWIFKALYLNMHFLTVSKSTKNDLIEWGVKDRNITVIHNGIYPPKIRPPEKKDKIITFFGSLSRDKGIETAIEVFAILKKENLQFKFWVIGKSEEIYLEKLKQQAKKLNVLKDIKFWGFVSEKQKNHLIARSTLIINPSIREGWGLTVIEAAIVGTPTIAFDVPGLRDSIKDKQSGILVKEKTPKAMADAILKILKNGKVKKMSKESLSWSKKFSWEKTAKESLELINELV